MHYNIHPFLLPPTLILITITLFLIYYLPITLQTTISNHKTHIINELSNDLFDETFILSQLNQFANDKISQEKTSVIQKQIYN